MIERYTDLQAWLHDFVIADHALNIHFHLVETQGLAAVFAGKQALEVLDVGCGGGQSVLRLKERYPHLELTGVDLSEPQIARARRRAQRKGFPVQFDVADAQALPFPDQRFDVVLSFGSVKHWPDPLQGIAECWRVLKPGGELLLVDSTSDATPEQIRRFLRDVTVSKVVREAGCRGISAFHGASVTPDDHVSADRRAACDAAGNGQPIARYARLSVPHPETCRGRPSLIAERADIAPHRTWSVMMSELNVDWRPKLPQKMDYGIGSVGCGGVVQYAHMPAYRNAGFKLVGAYDIKRENAEKAATDYDIPIVYDSLEALLADPSVDIVDIAVPAWEQLRIVEKVAAAGKHMLCQKPLAEDFGEAVKIVDLAQAAGVKQASNVQMRWDAGIAASKDLIRRGVIGTPTDAQIQVSVETAWHMWPWLANSPRLEVMYHSIHYLDAMRFLFGDPAWVTSRHARFVEQGDVKGETKTVTVLDYDSGLQALVAANHYNRHSDSQAVFRFIGTAGAIEGTIGLMYNYPVGRPDTLVLHRQGESPVDVELDEMWIPDAFVGPMAGLMIAIETDDTPATATADHLNTLRLVNAAYRSAAENRSLRPSEIQA